MRQRSVLAADDKDEAKLQTLGCVQRHHAHGIAGLVAIGVTEQGELRGQVAGAVVAALHGAKPVGQLAQIAQATFAQGRIGRGGNDLRGVAGAFEQRVHQVGGALVQRGAAQFVHQVGEGG